MSHYNHHSRSRSRNETTDKSCLSSDYHHYHQQKSHHHSYNPDNSLHSEYNDTPRKVYHGHHRLRYRAMSRKYDSQSQSNHHSSSYDQDRDDSKGHFMGESGDILNNKYKIIRELGTGTFARAFEVQDMDTHNYYALKVVRSVHRYYKNAKIESRIARDITRRDVSKSSHCYHIYDEFKFNGHYCMVVSLLGSSLYDVLKKNEFHAFPLSYIRSILKDLLEALQFMHSFGLVHTDLKLENLLFNSQHNQIKIDNRNNETLVLPSCKDVTLIDFGNAFYTTEKHSGTINTRQYRAPEVILGLHWNEESDIWGVGCIGMELFMGELLFQTHDDLLHIALIEHIVDKIPEDMIKHTSSHKQGYFHHDGTCKLDRLHSSERHHVEKKKTLKELIGHNYPQFYDLMARCLTISPQHRITASEALNHPFFNNQDYSCLL